MKRKKSKIWKTAFLTKDKLKDAEVLISRALIDSYISHDELF